MGDRLFPALLKYWRGRRGLSQLDLALAAEVSSRHVSFLEIGRAQPSAEMVLRLASALDVPLRDQNELLRAAGHEPRFAEPSLGEVPPPIERALERMMAQQEPYPLTVLSATYDVLRANQAAVALLSRFVAEPQHLPASRNVFTLLFDPRLVRPFVVDWDRLARLMVARLHREVLAHRERGALGRLLEEVFQYPDVPKSWRDPDFSTGDGAVLEVRFRRDDLELAFLTTVTAFNAPRNVTLDELRIESYFPLDEATKRACERLR
jgi:transcriptional regulator with XRE-family HTH domain